ncbi:MAG: primosomal protein N' [Planctomycetaceae bacterium]|nr:primosomal protein N' [Planctomycetaceae bacterium]
MSQQQQLFDDESAQPIPWEEAAANDRLSAEIVVNRPLSTGFHYLVPDGLRERLQPGMRVEIPFGRGNRKTTGFCVAIGPPPKLRQRLKEVASVLDSEPLVSAEMLELTAWIADRYLCGWGQVLESIIPAGVKKKAGTRTVQFFTVADDAVHAAESQKLPAKQRTVLDVLIEAGAPMRADEICAAADCGTAPIQGLRKKGLIQAIRQRVDVQEIETRRVEREEDLSLNDEQAVALSSILTQLRSGKHRTLLLHGVTGSGKTEVYMQAIREVVSYGRQAIVLVPEISLTPQTIRRFRTRFDSVAVLHSHLSDSERHWYWQQIARGAVQVVVGARSAVFAPTPNLGIIIIDEEHETTFKQDTTPRYHAREVAQQRAMLRGIPLVLGTATPTLESWRRVQRDIAPEHSYELISMKKRVEMLLLPPVTIVDTRNDPSISKGYSIGRALRTAIQATLKDRGQVILFLNVRGFSPVVWCRACGGGVKCPNCDITLTFHRDRKILLCHFCDLETEPLSQCPQCNSPGLQYFGTGTQKLEQEIKSMFPGANCLRMDSDSMRRHGSHEEALDAFRNGDVQILLGTQMIAKGLDFPNVTLVGVIDADTILHQPDLRSTERTFHLIAQVAGRTGRSSRGGRVLVQSANPSEPAIQFASQHDFVSFAQHELQHRRALVVPPFAQLARIILRGPVESVVLGDAERMAEELRKTIEQQELRVRVLGPAPAPIAKLKTNFRFHMQLTASSIQELKKLWHSTLCEFSVAPQVEFVVDVDPTNMR